MNTARILTAALAAMLGLLLSLYSPVSSADKVPEYQIKAAFIYNIARFTEWPEDMTEIKICIYGDDPFGSHIDSLDGKKVQDKTIRIMRTRLIKEVKQCNIAFLNIIPPEQRLFARALRELKDTRILTIADAMDVIHFGVMIGLLIDNDRVGFSVNHTATKSSELEISAKLLRLAKEVI